MVSHGKGCLLLGERFASFLIKSVFLCGSRAGIAVGLHHSPDKCARVISLLGEARDHVCFSSEENQEVEVLTFAQELDMWE